MTLEEALMQPYTKAMVNGVDHYIGNDNIRFAELMELFFHGEYRINQRAAAVMNKVAERKPRMIEPYLAPLVENLQKPELGDAIKRNTVRLFQFIKIPKDLYGPLANVCFQYLASHDEAIAIKVFSMRVLEIISEDIPEFRNELKILIEDQLPYGSTGFKSRGKKILKRLEKMEL